MIKRIRLTICVFCCVLWMTSVVVSAEMPQPALFFSESTTRSSEEIKSLPSHVKARRYATPNLGLIADGSTESIRLNLFADREFVVEHTRTDRFTAAPGYVWVGMVPDFPGSTVYLAVRQSETGDALYGSIQLRGEEWFTISQVGQGEIMIQALDPYKIEYAPFDLVEREERQEEEPEEERTVLTPAEPTSRSANNKLYSSIPSSSMPLPDGYDGVLSAPGVGRNFCVDGEETGDVVDVMIAYTVEACEVYDRNNGGAGGANSCTTAVQTSYEAWIFARIAEMNTANDNSLVNFDWNLVHIEPLVNYATTGLTGNDLNDLEDPTDPTLGYLHTVRDSYQADIVGLYVGDAVPNASGNTACGTANSLISLAFSFADDPFAVSAMDTADPLSFCSDLTMAHEIGHNMGNGHDTDNASGSILFPYSHGYDSSANSFHTIMAYDCPGACPEIAYWSNPNVTVSGEAIGVAGVSDNARSMNTVAPTAANWRVSCYAPPLVINEADIDTPGGTDTAEFIELKNVSGGTIDVSDFEIELVNGNGGGAAVYSTIALPAVNVAADDYYVVCTDAAAVPNCDFVVPTASNWVQNGAPDAIALRDTANGDQLVDTMSYGGDTGDPYTEITGTVGASAADYVTISRSPDGKDTNQNSVDLSLRCASPGERNNLATAPCTADLAISKAVAPTGALTENDPLTYSLLITNDGNIDASTVLTDLFGALVDAPVCTAQLTTHDYDFGNAPVEIGRYALDTANCTDTTGAQTTFFDGTNDAFNTSPIECEYPVPDDAIVATYAFTTTWDAVYNPVTCPANNCFSWDVNLVELEEPSGVVESYPLNYSSATSGDFTEVFTDQIKFNGSASQGTWKLRIYDDPNVTNLGFDVEMVNTRNQATNPYLGAVTELVLYGYPRITTTVSVPVADLTAGDLFNIPADGSLALSCGTNVVANACETTADSITNTATIASIHDASTPLNSNIVMNDLYCEADIGVTKTDFADPVLFNEPISYTLEIMNNGPSAARSVLLTDTLPAGVTLSSVNPTPDCMQVGSQIVCDAGMLTNGDTFSATIDVTINPNVTGMITNSAEVSTQSTDVITGNNTVDEPTEIVFADLQMSKTSDQTVLEPNAAVTYTIIITNEGTIAATTTFTDVYDTTELSNYTCTGANPVSIAPNGGTAEFVCTAMVEEQACFSAPIVNTANASAPEDPTNPAESTISQTINCVSDVVITKTADITLAHIGQTVTYQYTVHNTGNLNITGAAVTDAPLGGVTLGMTAIAPDGMTSGTMTHIVTSADLPGPIPNTGTVNGTTIQQAVTDSDDESVAIIVPEVSLGSSTATVGEGDGVVTLTAVLDQINPFADVTVTITTSDGTADSTDYTPTTIMVVIPAGQMSAAFTIPIVDDAGVEPDETFNVALSNPMNATVAAPDVAVVTIEDDDQTEITIEDNVIIEGDSGTAVMVFTITLSAQADAPISVTINTAPNGASDGGTAADYTPLANSVVTFPPNTLVQTISVPIVSDLIVENDEDFTVMISDPLLDGTADGRVTLADDSALGIIINDDDATITISDVTENEGDSGVTMFNFAVTLSAPVAEDVTVQFSTADNTATGLDYNGAFVPLVTFAAGGSLTQLASVEVVGETLVEPDETFTATLSIPQFGGAADISRVTIGDGAAVGTIVNDDAVELILNGATAVENEAQAVFTVTLSNPSVFTTTFVAETTDGTALDGADYSAISQLITVPPFTQIITIPVPIIDNTTFEASPELFTMTIMTPTNSTIVQGVAMGNIIDDDDPPALSVDDVTAAEDGTLQFTISLDVVSDLPVTFTYGTADQTAMTTLDYTMQSGTGVIPAGQSMMTVIVTPTVDGLDENDETFLLTLQSPVNATIADDEGVGTITDIDEPPLILVSGSTVAETAGTMPFTITLDAPSGLDVSVTYSTTTNAGVFGDATDGADFVGAMGTITIPAGMTTTVLSLTVLDDSLHELTTGEVLFVILSNAVNGTIGNPEAKLTILDDEPTPLLSISDSTVDEGAGFAVFTVTADTASSLPMTFTVDVAGGTADGDDVQTGTFLLFPTLAAEETVVTFTIPITDDLADEMLTETFTVTLNPDITVPQPEFADEIGIGTIIDNDDPPVLTISDATVNEVDQVATVVVSVVGASDLVVSFTVSSSAGTAVAVADYTPISGPLSGNGNFEITIPIPIVDDLLNEAITETFTIEVSDAINVTVEDGTGVITIIDNDDPPEITVEDVTVVESADEIEFTVMLSAVSTFDVMVDYGTADDTTSAGADYTSASGTITIPAGQLTTTITIPLTDDTLDEPDETFSLTLDDAVNGTIGDGEAMGTLLDDDDAPEITVEDVTVGESAADIEFTVMLSAVSAFDVMVDYGTADDTASAGADYTAASGTVTIPAGQLMTTITIPLSDDTLDEPDETFMLTLDNVINGMIGDGTAVGAILDDDEPAVTVTPTPTVTVTPTITPTPTVTVTPTVTPTPTVTITPTVTPTPTVTITPTVTPTPTVTITPTVTPTPTVTITPTITPTPTVTVTPTVTPTPTVTVTPTITPTPTVTVTPTSTPTPTVTITPTITPTSTVAITPTVTPTPTMTPTTGTDEIDEARASDTFGDASHLLGTALWIGEKPTDGIDRPTSYVEGDGIISYSIIEDGRPFTVVVPVVNNTGITATLSAYIDLDGDGEWSTVEALSVPVPSGGTFTITLPFGEITNSEGRLYSRFRVTTDSTITSTESAPDGEVEDWEFVTKPTQVILTRTAPLTMPYTTLYAVASVLIVGTGVMWVKRP